MPDPNTCQYFVKRKKRYCRMTVKKGSNYCGEHLPQEELNSESNTDKSNRKRVFCPLDPSQYVDVTLFLKSIIIYRF